ncbi:MAG: hypothetical protein WA673_12665 [Candidatus Acidiferrales bacterium]
MVQRPEVDSRHKGIVLVQIVWIVVGLTVLAAAAWHLLAQVQSSDTKFTTPYQAVLLTNVSVYFGHLSGYGGHTPVLTDVYYVVSQTNPETKQVNNVLVHRGKELHEPDRMYLNPQSIVFVEPVGTDSKVAQLIARQASSR